MSPFFLGPVELYDGYVAKNVENGWQFSKVYEEDADGDKPGSSYWTWAQWGWMQDYAYRYPKGKGAKPLFAWWGGEKLDYIEARKKIYCPLYAKAVERTPAFRKLKELHEAGSVMLFDFDCYDHLALGMNYEDVLNSEDKKMGHAFVLSMLLEDERVWE